ncbi:MAG: apolipoprotein N-acyltransferase [Pseudomonadota bacterium]
MQYLLAIMAGAAHAVSFAPFGWWPLGIVSLMILFGLWLKSDARSFLIGFMFGLAQFGIGISWMYISIHTFGGMPPIIAGLCIFALVAFMSLYPALCGWVQSLFRRKSRRSRLFFIIPAFWVAFEWLRGWLLTGLPWLTTGYAFVDTPAINLAPVGGVYAISLLVAVTAGVLIAIVTFSAKKSLVMFVLVAIVWAGSWQLGRLEWTAPGGNSLDVGVVQNNVPLLRKWDAESQARIIGDYLDASDELKDADVIVWPEAAIPAFRDQLPDQFWQRLQTHPADFISGLLERRTSGDALREFNSMFAVSGNELSLYSKQHLVPFGEYFPVPWLIRPLTEMLNIPMTNFSAWTMEQPPLPAGGIKFAASICYEDAFPHVWRDQVPASGALVNISEDMWFGDSLAPHQRLQMARFRTVETGRPMVRASNNGLSSLINHNGKILTIAPQFEPALVSGRIEPRTGTTPYVKYGYVPVMGVIAGWGLLGLLFGRRRLR